MWLYITSYLILIGAEVSAETEHQTVNDTTTGKARPMGERKAAMADTIGEATDKKEPSDENSGFYRLTLLEGNPCLFKSHATPCTNS